MVIAEAAAAPWGLLARPSRFIGLAFWLCAQSSRAVKRRKVRPQRADRSSMAPIVRKRVRAPWFRALTLVELDVASDVEELGWEQQLVAGLGPRLRRSLMFFRRSEVWLPSAENWRSLARPSSYFGPRHLLNPDAGWDPLPALPGTRQRLVLHVIGTPLPTTAGWRLRVRFGSRSATTESSYLAQQSDLRAVGASEVVLSVTDLDLHDTDVVVLQPEPDERVARALGSQRKGMLELAQDLISAGASAVIVLPVLTDGFTRAASQVVTDWAGRIPAGRINGPLVALALHKVLLRVVTDASMDAVTDGAEDPVAARFLRPLLPASYPPRPRSRTERAACARRAGGVPVARRRLSPWAQSVTRALTTKVLRYVGSSSSGGTVSGTVRKWKTMKVSHRTAWSRSTPRRNSPRSRAYSR